MRPVHEIQADLPNFTGTESYHRWSILFRYFVLTDGAKYVADECGAYWLMDAIASHLPRSRNEGFVVAKLARGKAVTYYILTLDDGNGNTFARQVIDHTNFPLEEITFYIIPQDDLRVIMLPSEY